MITISLKWNGLCHSSLSRQYQGNVDSCAKLSALFNIVRCPNGTRKASWFHFHTKFNSWKCFNPSDYRSRTSLQRLTLKCRRKRRCNVFIESMFPKKCSTTITRCLTVPWLLKLHDLCCLWVWRNLFSGFIVYSFFLKDWHIFRYECLIFLYPFTIMLFWLFRLNLL